MTRRAARRRGLVAAALLAVGAAAFVTVRYFTAEDRVMREILAAAAPSVGRVVAISMSGRSTPMGHAFAVAPGRMAAACDGLRGNAQVVVKLGTRSVSAQVDKVDPARNVCFLSVTGAGSWPLALRRHAPAPGEKVFAALLAPGGELAITPTEVTAVVPLGDGQALALPLGVEPSQAGAPVLDREGRVVGMLASRDGRTLALPAAWLQ
jgi:hypothetical protein